MSDEGTKVLPCGCNSPFQDKRYGKGLRLHNFGKKIKSPEQMRCTVCGREK